MDYLIIQLSTDEALFALFSRKGGSLVFTEATRHDLGQKPLEELLAEVAPSLRPGGRIILAVPPSMIFMREVSFPISDLGKIRDILPLELKGETALEVDDLVFEALPLEGEKILAIWGRKNELAHRIALLASHGLEPEFVTATVFHWHALLPAESRHQTLALTDGESLAVYRSGAPVSFRSLGSGDFITEVERTLAALEIGKGVKAGTLLLHGKAARSCAESPAATDLAVVALPVTGEPATTFAEPAAALDLAGAYALARGCATGELVNFRRNELVYTAGRARMRRKLLLTKILGASLVVLLFGELGLRYYLVKRDLDSINTSIRGIYRQAFPDRKKPVDEVAELRSEIRRLGGAVKEAPVLPVLKAIAALKSDDITGIYEAEIEGTQVRLKGDARSIQAASDFKARSAAVFSSAEVGEVKSRPDGTVSFVFRAVSKEGGK